MTIKIDEIVGRPMSGEDVIKAVKKQIPVKMDEVHSDLWICPVCEEQMYEQGKYCPNCGQALEWRK